MNSEELIRDIFSNKIIIKFTELLVHHITEHKQKQHYKIKYSVLYSYILGYSRKVE